MKITSADFFVLEGGEDGWPDRHLRDVVDLDRLERLVRGPEAGSPDVDASLALMDLIRDDLTLSGTSGGERLSDTQMRTAVRALERTTARAGDALRLPFRDHTTWRAYWIRHGASGPGGWQARRDLLASLFDPPYAGLVAAHDRALDATLVEPASPRDRLGWPQIDAEIAEVRRHFRAATTPQDYRTVGNDCVHVTEALSRQVYDHGEHGAPGEEEPPVAKTKQRLDRFVESRLPGPENAALRKYARATIELAQAVKHSGTPTRTEAGILADATIVLANLLRRLSESAD